MKGVIPGLSVDSDVGPKRGGETAVPNVDEIDSRAAIDGGGNVLISPAFSRII